MEKQFKLTDRDFNFFRRLVYDHSGITLGDGKRQLVYSRLTKRLRDLNLSSFKEYCQLLKDGDDKEMVTFINAITTNLTSFFREQHHFDFLRDQFFPQLMEKKEATRRIRIWSAGCSTGEEPYSLAMTCHEVFNNKPNWDVKILATDLDTNVLKKAKEGVYANDRVERLSKSFLKKYFIKGRGNNSGFVRVADNVRQFITFKHLNLMEAWPMRGKFDAIFCRNVIIYFDKDTQRFLIDRYAELLNEESYLFLGHSESLFKVTDRFKLIGQTIYKKVA